MSEQETVSRDEAGTRAAFRIPSAMTPEEREAHRAQATQAFWQVNAKGQPLIPQDVVDVLLSTGENVVIEAVRDGTSKFGPTWFTDIARDNGERWTCPQAHNAIRDRLMLSIRDFLASFGPMEAGLHGFDAAAGSGWDFGPPYEAAARADAIDATNDVPF